MKHHKIITIWRKYRVYLYLLVSGLCLLASFSERTSSDRQVARLVRTERLLHQKQHEVERLAQQALEEEPYSSLSERGVGEDVVLYKYVNDSLVSWVHEFPIVNDSYEPNAGFPNLSLFSGSLVRQKPLLQANETEQYLNLGSGWYVVQVYRKDNVKILTGILIQTTYPVNNAFISSQINETLKIPNYCSIVPLSTDEGFVVFGQHDGLLFTILRDVSKQSAQQHVVLRYLAILFALLALFRAYLRHKETPYALCVLLALGLLRFLCYAFAAQLHLDRAIYSPMLYAGSPIENSLASLSVNVLTVFLMVWTLYLARREWRLEWAVARPAVQRLMDGAWLVVGLALVWFIHHTLKTLIFNSNIMLEPYRLTEISWYTIWVYCLLAILFLALYQAVILALTVHDVAPSAFWFSNKALLFYLFMVALYTLFAVSHYGRRKELGRDTVWAQKMSIERDLELEMQLRRVEERIATDPVLSMMIQMEQDHAIILSRIRENYFENFQQRYRIQVTVCAPGDVLMVEGLNSPVPCYNFFHSEVLRYGELLAPDSHFYHKRNDLGFFSYVGFFTYYSYGSSLDMYIELDAEYIRDELGYPALLANTSQLDRFKLPYEFSYAKYIDNKLVSNSGDFSYPSVMREDKPEGTSGQRLDKHLHFFYRDGNKVVVISRPMRSLFPYLVTLSYLFLFYCLFFFGMYTTFGRRRIKWRTPRKSFRRKFTWLMLGSLVIALIFMAAGSLGFGLQLYDQANRMRRQDQLQTAKLSMEEYIRFVDRGHTSAQNLTELIATVNRLSANARIQVHLYDPQGRLLRSSQPELFERHIMSTRMNSNAYRALTTSDRVQYIQTEAIGSLSYLSMYTPLYNSRGELAAYLNVPYLSGQTDVAKDVSYIVATVINLYLILLFVALLLSVAVSNQITRPIAELGQRLSTLDVTKKGEHISYTANDEIGALVRAYNKMADDLAESTQRLAQTEREQAWREMARQIAHEIKNPLTPMRLSIQMLQRLKNEGSPKWTARFDQVAASILEQIDILARAASEFSSFSRFYMEDPAPVELNALVKEEMVLFTTFDHIRLHYESSVDQAVVLGRRTQLARLLVNLFSNAVQAVEGQQIGVITITLQRDAQPEYFLLQVADNGPGVAPQHRSKLFTPNFTTKSSGTGLGLAICRGIMEQSRGEIFYSTSEWGGACFNVRIPEMTAS